MDHYSVSTTRRRPRTGFLCRITAGSLAYLAATYIAFAVPATVITLATVALLGCVAALTLVGCGGDR